MELQCSGPPVTSVSLLDAVSLLDGTVYLGEERAVSSA